MRTALQPDSSSAAATRTHLTRRQVKDMPPEGAMLGPAGAGKWRVTAFTPDLEIERHTMRIMILYLILNTVKAWVVIFKNPVLQTSSP